jgi:tetratricopeptide (TPR) repeat protein
MKRGSLVLLFSIGCVMAFAQTSHLEDSLLNQYAHAKTVTDRITWLRELAGYYMGDDNQKSEMYGALMIDIADSSRDRPLMCRAYLANADRCFDMASVQQYIAKALDYTQKAMDIARANNLDEYTAWSYMYLARGSRQNGESDKALNYNNLALSIATNTSNDSLKTTAYNALGNTYLYKNEKLLAFRNYLQAQIIAEETGNTKLIEDCYSRLSGFYTSLENYEKAKDYEFKRESLQRRDNRLYDLLRTYNTIGGLYLLSKQTEQARRYYEKTISLADTLHFEVSKLSGYMSIVAMYLFGKEYQKGLDYFNSHQELSDYLRKANLSFYIDNLYGAMYTSLGKLDSARYYFIRAAPEFEARGSLIIKYYFYNNYATYFRRKQDYDSAIVYYLKAGNIGERSKNLEYMQAVANNLDSMYQLKGDYKNAFLHSSMAFKYKDSLQKMAKEKDLLSLEIDSENKRKERDAQRELAETRRRHNIQYLGITVAIAAIFILLIMAGVFSVSRTTIKALGFFAFIFLFEFIILLADNQIHDWTHGEPWKVMIFKIGLIAVLLPLHHWMEEKAIHYLTTQELLRIKGKGFLGKLFRKKDADLPMGNL